MGVKEFTTTGICNPEKHYMVDISERLAAIKEMIDKEKYFCINRGRQYGKTTTLSALRKYLQPEYEVASLSFQGIGEAGFQTEEAFVQAFCRLVKRAGRTGVTIPEQTQACLDDIVGRREYLAKLDELYDVIIDWCADSEKPVVLMIDEVDSATNNQVFLDFLAQLREAYLEREDKGTPAFHSVILAGVTDVRHLKAKIRPDEAHRVNSPWNIASDFNVDMSLPVPGIRGMLEEYEEEHYTGMDTALIAQELHNYTGGYPYLVSRLCQLMDGFVREERGAEAAWTVQGLDEAIKTLLADGESPLFGSLMGKLENMPRLKGQLRDILMKGEAIPWRPDDEEQKLLYMFGFIFNDHNTVRISNRLFEMRLYQYFLGENRMDEAFRSEAQVYKPIFINDDNTLNMPLILERFVETQKLVYGEADDRFLEEEGRERFLTYIAPIINGTGTYSIEEQTRSRLRMDVVIHWLGKRYVVELKIWLGPRYNEDGEEQIMGYLDYFGLNTGYMVSFNFNKNKKRGVQRVAIREKILFEATV